MMRMGWIKTWKRLVELIEITYEHTAERDPTSEPCTYRLGSSIAADCPTLTTPMDHRTLGYTPAWGVEAMWREGMLVARPLWMTAGASMVAAVEAARPPLTRPVGTVLAFALTRRECF